MRRLGIEILCLAFLPVLAYSQDNKGQLPSRTMTIEGIYDADVTDADKIMPVPGKLKNKPVSGRPDYLLDANPFMEYLRDGMDAPDSIYRQAKRYPALIKLGYGVRGELDFLADYRTRCGKSGELKLNASAGGWNTKIEDDWRSKLYDVALNAGYVYDNEKFRLDVNGEFGIGYLNFRQVSALASNDGLGRNLMSGGLNVGITPSNAGRWNYSARVGWSVYTDDRIPWGYDQGIENKFRLDGKVGYGFSDALSVAADVSVKSMLYNCSLALDKYSKYKNCTTFSVAPKISYGLPGMSLTAGADVSIRSLLVPTVRISPFLDFQYQISNSLRLYAGTKGGVDEYDMRYLHSFSPYWVSDSQIHDGYTAIDASLGLVWNPSEHLELQLDGGYRKYYDKVFQMMYKGNVYGSYITQSDAGLTHIGLSAKYLHSSRLSLHAAADYNKWHGCDAKLPLLLPELNIGIGGEFLIIDRLTANMDYRYSMMSAYEGSRLPYASTLDIGLRYALLDRLDIALNGTNLLNNRYYRFAECRNRGISVSLSALYRF